MALEWRVLHDLPTGWKEFKPPEWEVFRPVIPMWGMWKKLWMAVVKI